jgi:hypothetical protein
LSWPGAIIAGMPSTIDLVATAHRHLPADIAARWIALLRPAIQLQAHDAAGRPEVGYYGGEPALPTGEQWPVWPGHGPLTLVASIDCARLPAVAGLPLPPAGRLLFFYFDGQYDNGEALVYFMDPESRAGARVVFVPAGLPSEPAVPPAGIEPYQRRPMYGDVVDTAPGYESLAVQNAFPESVATDSDHPVCSDDFVDALDLPYHFGDQLGGHPVPFQGPVEFEVAQAALSGVDGRSQSLWSEAARWRLLAQFNHGSHGGLKAGVLYWMIKEEDLTACRFDRALFTRQC